MFKSSGVRVPALRSEAQAGSGECRECFAENKKTACELLERSFWELPFTSTLDIGCRYALDVLVEYSILAFRFDWIFCLSLRH